MRSYFSLLTFVLLASIMGFSMRSDASTPANYEVVAQTGKIDACTLITTAEFSAVQGDSLKETKASSRKQGDLAVSQCFYLAQTFSKSVNVMVTQSTQAKGSSKAMKEIWEKTFRDEGEHAEEEIESERKAGSTSTEIEREEEEGSDPVKIDKLGDEAFWMGDARSGVLYVLRNNSYLRISIGGADDQDARLRKATLLAKQVLKRLK